MGALTSKVIGRNLYKAASVVTSSSMNDTLTAVGGDSSKGPWKYLGFRFHADTTSTGATLSITIDATAGSTMDFKLFSQDMTDVKDLLWQPNENEAPILYTGEILNIDYTYPSTGSFQMVHFWRTRG